MMLSLVIFVSACALSVSAVFEDGGVSGDTLEHWNMFPHNGPNILRSEPVQSVHFTIKGKDKVQVTWFSPFPYDPHTSNKPVCEYGESGSNLTHQVEGTDYTYTAGHFEYTLNTATLDLSVLSSIYAKTYYWCGIQTKGWSEVFSFQIQPPNIDTELHFTADNGVQSQDTRKAFALIGDLGVTHGADTMIALRDFVRSGLVKMVVHAGDISYADNFSRDKLNNSYIWVDYMNQISVFTPWVPYMTCPGNHEAQFNFAAYLNWLPMPYAESGSESPFWWSFDYMGVHFLSFSTEHDFSQVSEQYRFMENDLRKANENRANVPWVIVFGHRPLYCTCALDAERCTVEAPRYRFFLENLLQENKVDVYVDGHNHNYERSYPVYKEKATQKDFVNPEATVYIVNGEAGNPEPNNPSFHPGFDWRANFSASTDNGFLLMTPTINTLNFQYIRSMDSTVADEFTIVRQ